VRRYRPDTPAARLRDAHAHARARRATRLPIRVELGSSLTVCLAALVGVAVTAPGATTARHSAPGASAVGAATAPTAASHPDGRVADPLRLVRPLPAGWVEVGPLVATAVADAADAGHELAACVMAIDSPDERVVCAGGDEPRYAASVIKVAYAVGALEAWEADPSAQTPYGRLGDLLEAAITVSDNDAANVLYDLSVDGPAAPDTTAPVSALGDIADRVGLAEQFHTGGAFRYEWTGDWSHVTPRGSVRYLAELVRAADGRAPAGEALTSPAVARLVLDTMLAQERRWKLPDRLPEGTVANKTGETDTESHDIAVVNTASGRYAIAVIASADGMFNGPDEVMADLGHDVVAALGGAVRF